MVQQAPNNFGLALILIVCFSLMLARDNLTKKCVFSICYVFILQFALSNPFCPKTGLFLLVLVSIQVCIIGPMILLLSLLKKINKKNDIYDRNYHRINFLLVFLILAVGSLVGLAFCLKFKYYQELFESGQLWPMIGMVGIGFGIVAAVDWGYMMNRDIKITTRRKIFHFVPMFLLPLLSFIDYKLFLLMVFGSFYLFWLLEIIRYFGKLAKEQFLAYSPQNVPNIQNCFTLKSTSNNGPFRFGVGILKLPILLILKVLDWPFMTWMDELNGIRQKGFWFTHLSLILGLSMTYIYFWDVACLRNISLILVAGDAVAAMVGKNYGRFYSILPFPNSKTLQGFLAYIGTTFLFQILLLFLYEETELIDIWWILVMSICCGICQLFSGDLDNITMSLAYIAVYAIGVKLNE